MPDILNFSLLGTVWFCIPVISIDLCSGMQFSYLEAVLSFSVLFLRFLGGTAFSLGLILPMTET